LSFYVGYGGPKVSIRLEDPQKKAQRTTLGYKEEVTERRKKANVRRIRISAKYFRFVIPFERLCDNSSFAVY
jgi:hypothetical protein